jgi:hypothetical protein
MLDDGGASDAVTRVVGTRGCCCFASRMSKKGRSLRIRERTALGERQNADRQAWRSRDGKARRGEFHTCTIGVSFRAPLSQAVGG